MKPSVFTKKNVKIPRDVATIVNKTTVSQTQLKQRKNRKSNSTLIETIDLARKNKAWVRIAQIIGNSTRLHAAVNLSDINALVKNEKVVVVPGKVLGSGVLDKKVRVAALAFSSSATEKLEKAKIDFITLAEEIKKNPKAEGILIIA
ncbi:MAG: 50S ribosomal protein L18e [archaeon]